MTVIRDYRDADDRAAALRLIALLQDTERQFVEGMRPGAEMAAAYLDSIVDVVARQNGRFLVAERQGAVSGLLSCYIEPVNAIEMTPQHSRMGWIGDLVVLPEARGEGIARLLLAAAERHFLGLPRPPIYVRLEVLTQNRDAVALYESSGYRVLETVFEKRLR